ncbi:MAG: c-type cytochrome biogenesis protein CcmI [Jhaorihella sp.]
MTFWIIVTLLALAVATLLVLAMLRGRTGAEPAASYDLRVYRDQLKDVDRDLARGVIAQADAERTRAEVSRRILAADAQLRQEQAGDGQPRRLSAAVAVVLAAVLLGGSAWIYLALGTPGQRDLPLQMRKDLAEQLRRERPGQEAAEARMPARPAPEIDADYAALLEQLRRKVGERPDDLQGHLLLARHEANVGNFAAAREAQQQAIALMGEDAGPGDYAELGELMILASGGYVSPQAELALKQALERDPFNGPARYYWGLMQAQTGRPDLAFDTWERTLRRGPPDAPWLEPIRAQIEEMAWRAGVRFELPETAASGAGPSRADMEAAGGMSAAERQAMIRGMVDGLADRLSEEGGDAGEWARLISALAVLGEEARARKALEDARAAHAGDAGALAEIEAAARDAGLIQ